MQNYLTGQLPDISCFQLIISSIPGEHVSPVDRSRIFHRETTKSSLDQLCFSTLMNHHLGIRWLTVNPKHCISVSRKLNFGSSNIVDTTLLSQAKYNVYSKDIFRKSFKHKNSSLIFLDIGR